MTLLCLQEKGSLLLGSLRVTEFRIMQYIECSELNASSGCEAGHGGFALVSTWFSSEC